MQKKEITKLYCGGLWGWDGKRWLPLPKEPYSGEPIKDEFLEWADRMGYYLINDEVYLLGLGKPQVPRPWQNIVRTQLTSGGSRPTKATLLEFHKKVKTKQMAECRRRLIDAIMGSKWADLTVTGDAEMLEKRWKITLTGTGPAIHFEKFEAGIFIYWLFTTNFVSDRVKESLLKQKSKFDGSRSDLALLLKQSESWIVLPPLTKRRNPHNRITIFNSAFGTNIRQKGKKYVW